MEDISGVKVREIDSKSLGKNIEVRISIYDAERWEPEGGGSVTLVFREREYEAFKQKLLKP